MCDTAIIYSKNSQPIFLKNSDREPDEPQIVIEIPSKESKSQFVQCTYISIPQVHITNKMILSKPTWIWGAEMGVNDKGVVIGNEAVFTNQIIKKNAGLIGMDLLRLGLERGNTAKEALFIITSLLEQYGQSGVCGFKDKNFYYDNAFIIADPQEAFILETAGKHWVSKKIDTAASISNGFSIGEDYHLSSKGVEDFARQNGLLKRFETFHFAKAFSDRFYTLAAQPIWRKNLILSCITQNSDCNILDAMRTLRSHQSGTDITDANKKGSNRDVCMHAHGIIGRHQTTNSMIVVLDSTSPMIFTTATSLACTSIFKPVTFWNTLDDTLDENSQTSTLWSNHYHITPFIIKNPELLRYHISHRSEIERSYIRLLHSQKRKDSSLLRNLQKQSLQWENELVEMYH